MADKIATNLVLNTSLRAPRGTGLTRVKEQLMDIKQLMTDINSQQIVIDIKLRGSKQAVSSLKAISIAAQAQLNRQSQQAAQQAAPKTGPITQPTAPVQPGVSTGNIPPRTGGTGPTSPATRASNQGFIGTGSKTVNYASGDREYTVSTARQNAGRTSIDKKFKLNPDTGQFEEFSETTRFSNDENRLRLQRQRELELRPVRRGFKSEDELAEFDRRGRSLDTLRTQAQQSGFQTESRVGKTVTTKGGNELQHSELLLTKQLADGRISVQKYSTATDTLTAAVIKETEASKAAAAAKKRDAQNQTKVNRITDFNQRGESLSRRFKGRGFSEETNELSSPVDSSDPSAGRVKTKVRRFERTSGIGKDEVKTIYEYNEAHDTLYKTVKRTSAAVRESNNERRNAEKIAQIGANTTRAAAQEQQLLADGYTKTNTSTKQLTVGTQQLTVATKEYHRVSGSALLGTLELEIAKVDERTGQLTKTTLNGNKAVRQLGDSFTSAVAKVGLWFAATSVIFLFARGAAEAATQVKALEANTIFLARVGQNLGETFNERYKEARRLTSGIADLSAVIGVSATESQRAAAVFLRAGQDRVQALESTKAAMLAASIAELEVEDAAKLLSSAQKQFNLASSELIPTLDTLNSLSNKYVVTTDDLLQSISRGGKIYADANGRIESLAATTAILADRTRRSGAEIGNALKTIQARLTSVEVAGLLSEKLGLSMYTASGQAKDFSTVLLQLQGAMVNLSNEQRDQIGVTIAGARQYNILKNALDGVIDIAIAEARALRDSGSATEEAIQRSTSLEAALGRLGGEFTRTISNAASATGGILTTLINLVNIVLSLANAFDGFGIKVASTAAAFIVLYAILSKYNVAANIAASSGVKLALSLLSTGKFATAASVGVGFLTTSLRALIATMLPTLILAGFLTAGFALLALGVSAWTASMVEAGIMGGSLADQAAKQAERTERERRAVQTLTDAMAQQIETQRQLNKAEAEGKPVSQEAKDKTRENIVKLSGGLGIEAPTGPLTEDKLIELQKKRIEAINKATEDLKKAYEAQIIAEKDGLKELQDTYNTYGTTAAKQQEKVNELEANNAEPRIISYAKYKLKELKKIEGQIAESGTRIRELEGKLFDASQIPKAEVEDGKKREANDKGFGILREIKDFEETQKYKGAVPVNETKQAADNLALLTNKQKDLIAVASTFTPGSAQWTMWAEQVGKVTEKVEQLNAELVKTQFSSSKTFFNRILDPSTDINRSVIAQSAKVDFARVDGKGFGGPRFENLTGIKADIAANRTIAAQAAKDIWQTELEGGADTPEKQAYIEAQREQIAKALEAARKGEVAAAQELLNIELDITKERVNQNKEAAKAAGLLNDEDKVKLLSQAEYFRANPNKQLNATDAFFASADGNRLGQQFYGSRFNFDQQDVVNSGFRDVFGADFGVSKDLVDAEKELAKRGIGSSANQADRDRAVRDNRTGIYEDTEAQASLTGEVIPGNSNQPYGKFGPLGAGANFAPPINVGGSWSAIDLDPIIKAFDEAINNRINESRAEIIKNIKAVWQPVKDAGLDQLSGLPGTQQ